MNTSNENYSSPIEEKSERGYIVTIGHERIRVVSIFSGTKSASKASYDVAMTPPNPCKSGRICARIFRESLIKEHEIQIHSHN